MKPIASIGPPKGSSNPMLDFAEDVREGCRILLQGSLWEVAAVHPTFGETRVRVYLKHVFDGRESICEFEHPCRRYTHRGGFQIPPPAPPPSVQANAILAMLAVPMAVYHEVLQKS